MYLVMHEYATVTAIWKDVLERFNRRSEKLQTPNLDVDESESILSSLN